MSKIMFAGATESHCFAVYVPKLSHVLAGATSGDVVTISDDELRHRVTRVLRLEAGESLLLFDDALHVLCALDSQTFATKKALCVLVHAVRAHTPLQPTITLYCGLLKKDAYADVATLATAMGASVLQPVLSSKVQRAWGGSKEAERLERMSIAAREQSKNFAPLIQRAPISFEQLLIEGKKHDIRLCFHEQGALLIDVLIKISTQKNIALLIGPEGDFTSREYELLKAAHWQLVALTPTVLRSVDAVAVALGCVRSVTR